VDEYVYISDAKLRALIPRDPRWWARMRARRVQAGIHAPGTQIGVDMEADELLKLAARLHKAEYHAAGTAKWYEDETLTAGDWMFFEGRIGCHVIDLEPRPGAVLFCQIQPTNGRLVLLHGSAAHLIDRPEIGNFPVSVTTPFSSPAAFPRIVQKLLINDADPLWMFWRRFNHPNPATAEQDLQLNLAELHTRVIGTEWFQASAPYLAGFAYVSGIVPELNATEVVVGSPLFVRRARPGS
jgi:hypothetical protein